MVRQDHWEGQTGRDDIGGKFGATKVEGVNLPVRTGFVVARTVGVGRLLREPSVVTSGGRVT